MSMQFLKFTHDMTENISIFTWGILHVFIRHCLSFAFVLLVFC